MTFKSKIMTTLASVALMAGTVVGVQSTMAAGHGEEITVAYFLEWPMPFQYGKVTGAYEKELGAKINWVSFDSGVKMSAAMASGDVHMSVSQGVPPFVVATSAGQDLQILDVAVSYAENDNCVVQAELEINKDNAQELAGKKVAVPLGTAAHYGFLEQMKHFGVDVASLDVVDMDPPDAAAAFAQDSVDMFCGWGGSLVRALEHGNVLLTGDEKVELGILVFDVTSAPASWVAEHSEIAAKFLKVTAEMNAMWNSGNMTSTMLPVIAQDAGMSVGDTRDFMTKFQFPSVDEQLSSKWLNGSAQTFMKGVADVFLSSGEIPAAKSSYAANVNTGPLNAAKGMM